MDPNNRAQPAATRFSLRRLLALVAVVSACMAIVSHLYRAHAREQARLVKLKESDKETVIAIVKEVQAIQTKLGRAPKDTEELEALLGKPMPFVHDNGHPTQINYHRADTNRFYLQYWLTVGDDWIYDSAKPKAGWVQHYD
jgi:hypothetical protein